MCDTLLLGEIDLEILTQLRAKHPDTRVAKEVVEPSGDMLYKYKGYTLALHICSLFFFICDILCLPHEQLVSRMGSEHVININVTTGVKSLCKGHVQGACYVV